MMSMKLQVLPHRISHLWGQQRIRRLAYQYLFHDISEFLLKWLPRLTADHRHYLTVAIGCTGGQHRSVYMVDRLADFMKNRVANIQTLHRELIRKK